MHKYCSNCGAKHDETSAFCTGCGEKLANVYPIEKDIINKKEKAKRKKSSTIVMWIIIFLMGVYITVDIVRMIPPIDRNVKLAISELTSHWKEWYNDYEFGDGYLEIIHTRVVEIDPSQDSKFSTMEYVDRANEIKYIVEFDIYTDYRDSAPYYDKTEQYNNVIIYKDGTSKVTSKVLERYGNIIYDYKYSKVLVNVKDYGDSFNRVINLD